MVCLQFCFRCAASSGCIKAISSQLNGDATSMVVNIDFENSENEFVGRGFMRANQYNQTPFVRNDYFTYVEDEKALKNVLKGTVNWQEKLNDALKIHKTFEKKVKNKPPQTI